MRKLLYYFLAGPFILAGSVIGFLVWEIIDTHWKTKIRFSNPPTIQQQGEYIQHLLKKSSESNKHEDELHVYYQRQLKMKDTEISRLRYQLQHK